MRNIVVSIHCITYNHEKYIGEAIESFLMQNTNFNFEILIYDDASTDGTQAIIKQYEEKYPNLIKPIYQTENQYSQGKSVNHFNLNRAKGKYIAVCEGDDYWTDPYKLQKQVDYMEKNPECSLCVHGGHVVTSDDKKVQSIHRPSKRNKIFTVEEVIEGDGSLFLTNTMLLKKEFALQEPEWIQNAPTSDYSYAINLALLGTVYYIDEMMSAYRVGHSGAWTARIYNNMENRIQHYAQIARMLDELNEYTNRQYDEVIERTKMKTQLYILKDQRKFDEIKNGQYKELYKGFSFKQKLILFMDQYIPVVSHFFRNVKRRFHIWTSA